MKLSNRIIAAVLLVVGSSGAVYAFSKHGDWGMSPQEKVEFVTDRVTKKLELDSQQQQNFSTLAEMVAQLLVDAKATRAEHIGEIGNLLQEPNLDQSRALELVRQKTEIINREAPGVIASLAIFLDSLSDAQKQQLQQFIEKRHHRHGDHG
jgi:protein CpxP